MTALSTEVRTWRLVVTDHQERERIVGEVVGVTTELWVDGEAVDEITAWADLER